MIKTIENQFNARFYDLKAVRKLESMGFIDDSWGNDSCPKFYYSGKGYTVLIWIETIDPNMREFEGEKQFTATLQTDGVDGIRDGEHWIDGTECLEDLCGLFNITFPKCKIPSYYPC